MNSSASSGPSTRGTLRNLTDQQKLDLLLIEHDLSSPQLWERAYKLVEADGLGELLLALTAKKTGRKAVGLTVVDVLAAAHALSAVGQSPYFERIARALHSEMPAHLRAARGITRPWPAPTLTGPKRRQLINRASEAVKRRFGALAQPLDSYRGPRHTNLELADLIEIAKAHVRDDPTGENRQQADALLVDITNALIHASLDLLPTTLLDQLDENFAIDGTFVPTYARAGKNHKTFRHVEAKVREHVDPDQEEELTPEQIDLVATALATTKANAKLPSRISVDPEAGHYIRGQGNESQYKGFGYEANLAIVGDSQASYGQTRLPMLVVAATFDAPSRDPGPNAVTCVEQAQKWAKSHGHTLTCGIFDALYPTLSPQHFMEPLRRMGVSWVARLREDRLGIQGSFGGLILVEGAWYCASMPRNLIDASKDRDASRIDEDTYVELLRKRADYASYRINGNKLVKDDGTFIDPRHACPNTRPTNPANCKNGIDVPNSTLTLPIKALNAQVKPAACTQRTLTIPTAVGIAGEQAHPYKSPEWKATHNRLRSGNEGVNGNLKSPGGVAIGTPGRRRIRGRAPNAIMSSVMIAAANVTAIRNFLQNATPDVDGTLKREYSTYRRTRATEKAAAKNQQKAAGRRKAKPTLRKQPTAMTRAVSARTGNLRT